MIYKHECFSAECDGCKDDFESQFEGFTLFIDETTLTERMVDSGWYIGDNPSSCYCEKCHQINDKDEFVLIGKAALLADKPIQP